MALNLLRNGDLAGNRTRDCAVRGRRLNRLTTRPYLRGSPHIKVIISYPAETCNRFSCGKEKNFPKKDIRLCRTPRKDLTRIFAGGCRAPKYQPFRILVQTSPISVRPRLPE